MQVFSDKNILTTKDLVYMGIGTANTISKYVKQGMPRHGKRGRYFFIKEEVEAWLMEADDDIYINCPVCGQKMKFRSVRIDGDKIDRINR